MTTLPHKVVYYLPSVQRDGKPVGGWTGLKAHAIQKILADAGGLTESDGYGYWKAADGYVVREYVTLLTVFYADEPDVAPIARWILDAYNQESVAVEVNGELRLFGRDG